MLSPRRFSPVVLCVFSLLCATSVFGRPADRAQLLSEIAALRDQLRATSDPAQVLNLQHQIQIKELQFLSPAPEDQEAHAAFLRQPEAGLIRLLPRGKFDGVLLVRGGGAYYSFPRRTHAYDYGSDIELQSGEFSVGFAGADFGFLVRRGETPLAAVTLDLPAVQYLAALQAPTTEPEAREQQRRSGAGLDQVNLLLPLALAGRGAVAIALEVGGRRANPVTVNIR